MANYRITNDNSIGTRLTVMDGSGKTLYTVVRKLFAGQAFFTKPGYDQPSFVMRRHGWFTSRRDFVEIQTQYVFGGVKAADATWMRWHVIDSIGNVIGTLDKPDTKFDEETLKAAGLPKEPMKLLKATFSAAKKGELTDRLTAAGIQGVSRELSYQDMPLAYYISSFDFKALWIELVGSRARMIDERVLIGLGIIAVTSTTSAST